MSFTEKGLTAIENIKQNYSTADKFTAAMLGVAPAVLTSLAKEGYLIRQDTKPVSYICDDMCRRKIEADLPKSFAPYSITELEAQINMNYQGLVEYCLNKYGKVPGTYFCTPEMKSPNPKIKRGKEGLYVHHIKEDSAIMLSNPLHAKTQPWEYQMPHNLVYCNIFEHLLLHICIVREYDESKMGNSKILPGIGGVFNLIWPQICDFFDSSHAPLENITYIQAKAKFLPILNKLKSTSLYDKFLTSRLEALTKLLPPKKPVEKSHSPESVIRIKRSDGRIYDDLNEACKSVSGKGYFKTSKLEKAIINHTQYGGFYWEYVKEGGEE